ncbi:DUF448 domain-containing protein [Nitratiruptor sp. YY08-14]|uniref:DUF448 domain-containing protein n=1 Tax=unclassified Nitratiruptor TaxID=2624044 RepID=UPI00351C6AFD
MCIHCRKREPQEKLIRVQCIEKKITRYQGVGRSFYICNSCLDDKKLQKSLARICKIDPISALKMLKEIVDNG